MRKGWKNFAAETRRAFMISNPGNKKMSDQITLHERRAMPQSSKNEQAVPVKSIWILFFGSLSLIPLSMALGLFDTATELIPRHEKVDLACWQSSLSAG